MAMTQQERMDHCTTQLAVILSRLEGLKNEPIEAAELENMKMRIQIYGILLNFDIQRG